MIIAELPPDEELRLADLVSYDILDTAAEEDFDELVELAGQICNCPISLITLLDKDRQWFKAKTGLEDGGTPRDIAFCAHAILQDEVFVVDDATKDERFFDNPLVTGDLGIRFFAGAPIVSPSGYNMGTICIIDKAPKKLSDAEERALVLLSKQVTKLLELRNKNKLLRKRAEEIITLKGNMINRAIRVQENDKKAIALTLHEDMAQSLASSIMYIKMAIDKDEKRLPLMQLAKQQLNDMLADIRDLSNSIIPATIDWIPAENLVTEFIEKTAMTYPYQVKLEVLGEQSNGKADQALVIIRILEEWLKLLAKKKEILQVNIILVCGDRYELLIENDGPLMRFENLKKDVFDSLIYDRVRSAGGSVEFSHSGAKNLLKIKLPIFAGNNIVMA